MISKSEEMPRLFGYNLLAQFHMPLGLCGDRIPGSLTRSKKSAMTNAAILKMHSGYNDKTPAIC